VLINIVIVGIGGFSGSILRYLITLYASKSGLSIFPWGTTIVNVVGSIIIGLIFGLFDRGWNISPEARLLLTTGFCGGFTTFSTFSFEFIKLLEDGELLIAFTYMFANILLSTFLCLIVYRFFRG